MSERGHAGARTRAGEGVDPPLSSYLVERERERERGYRAAKSWQTRNKRVGAQSPRPP